MNKTILLILIGGVVILGGFMYFTGEKNNEMTKSNTALTSTEIKEQPSGKKMAFTEFTKQGGSYKCIVNQSVSDVVSKGTIFISGGMMRGTFTTTISGKENMSNILVRDGYTYIWSPEMPMAMKIAIPKQNTETNTNTGMSGSYSWNAEQIGDYDCEAWNADQTMFAIPSGTEFMDPSQMGTMYKR